MFLVDTNVFVYAAERSGPEHDRLYQEMAKIWPPFIDYQKRTQRTIPVAVLERQP